jgi:hypothetical protein
MERTGIKIAFAFDNHFLQLGFTLYYDRDITATAKASGCEAIVGNDFTWAKIEVVPVILLDDYCNDRENP